MIEWAIMKNAKRYTKIFLLTFIGIAIAGGVIYMTFPFTNPRWFTGALSLSRPESTIRRDLLRITPIGTGKEDVIYVISEREWTLRWVRETSGYFMNRGRASDGPNHFMIESGESFEVGTQSIRIHLGRFHIIFAVDVDVYYAFDEYSKLIDIAIRREMDVI